MNEIKMEMIVSLLADVVKDTCAFFRFLFPFPWDLVLKTLEAEDGRNLEL